MLFLFVLTMISGARELLTPGAWHREGATYSLNVKTDKPTALSTNLEMQRRQKLELLRLMLWTYAVAHDGQFPDSIETSGIAAELWQQPGAAHFQYGYHGGLKIEDEPKELIYEYQLYGESPRLILKTDGSIRPVNKSPTQASEAGEPQP